jgi:hypothetical protein
MIAIASAAPPQFNFKETTMSNGNIVQCIGAVVDIKFPARPCPRYLKP